MVDSQICALNESMHDSVKMYNITVKSADDGFTIPYNNCLDRAIVEITMYDTDGVGLATATVDVVKLNYPKEKLITAAVTLVAGKGDSAGKTLREMLPVSTPQEIAFAKSPSIEGTLRFNYTATKDGKVRLFIRTIMLSDLYMIDKISA